MWLIPDRPGTPFAYHQLKFTPEERRGRLRLYASPDGADGSMPINTDARIHAGLFEPGDRIEHPLRAGRGAWLQVVSGAVEAAGLALAAGDGVGITGIDPLELRFTAPSEILLFDLGMDAPLLWR